LNTYDFCLENFNPSFCFHLHWVALGSMNFNASMSSLPPMPTGTSTAVPITQSAPAVPTTTVIDGMIKRKGCKCNQGKDLFHGELGILGTSYTAENQLSQASSSNTGTITAASPPSWQINAIRP
jgi:hypothetical protein